MYRVNQRSYIRPYIVKDCPEVLQDSNHNIHEPHVIELLAYYRGEKVTKWMVADIRDELGQIDDLPLPVHSSQRITFKCKDGDFTPRVGIATLARHYELIANLYELDPDVKEIDLPFTVQDVQSATIFLPNREVSLELLDFLMPKRTETYLWFKWSTMTEERARMIGRGLEKETKMHLSRLASILPDEELYPIIEWATLTDNRDVLYSLLEKKAPSVLFWCLLNRPWDSGDFLRTHTFNDEIVTMAPRELRWEPRLRGESGLSRVFWIALERAENPKEMRYLLALFGISCIALDNTEKVIAPFSSKIIIPDRTITESALGILSTIDEDFTKELKNEAMSQLYPLTSTWSNITSIHVGMNKITR